jgi:hypothetical protein
MVPGGMAYLAASQRGLSGMKKSPIVNIKGTTWMMPSGMM